MHDSAFTLLPFAAIEYSKCNQNIIKELANCLFFKKIIKP